MSFGLYKETRTPTGEPQLILVEQGVGHRITDPQAFEQATGQRLTNLPQANVNTMSGDISFAEARQQGFLEPILGSQFASPTVEYVNWAGTQDVPRLSGFYPKGTSASLQRQASETEARRLNPPVPQTGAPTEFQQEFARRRSAGEAPETILRSTAQTIQPPSRAMDIYGRGEPTNRAIPATAGAPPAGYIVGYDTNNNFARVYVKPGIYYPGISLRPPTGVADRLPITTERTVNAGALTITPSTSIVTGVSANTIETLAGVAGSTLTGIDRVLFDMAEQQRRQAENSRTTAEQERQRALAGLEAATIYAPTMESEVNRVLNQFQINQKQQALNDIKTQINQQMESLQLGQLNERNRIAPMEIIGRRQALLQEQASIRIGSLSAAARVLQDDRDSAMNLAQLTLNAVNNDRQNRVQAYQMLLNLADNQITTLKAEEREQLRTEITILQNRQKQDQKNADQMVKIMTQYPEAFVQARVSLTDNPTVAMQKMTPYIQNGDNRKIIAGYMTRYPDAGISFNDSLAVAQSKIKNRRIYKQATRLSNGRDETDKILTINQIEQFRRSYGWTPPYGYTQSQLLQFMKDNPDATPEQLEEGARQAGRKLKQPTEQFLNEDYFRNNFTKEELKTMSDKLGTSKWYTPVFMDINRFLKKAMIKVEEARQQRYSDQEILEFLKT